MASRIRPKSAQKSSPSAPSPTRAGKAPVRRVRDARDAKIQNIKSKTRLASVSEKPVAEEVKSKKTEAALRKARVHAEGQARLDRVLDYVTFVASPLPLMQLLDEAPKRIAEIVSADVALLFLLEGDKDELVLRGSIGFPLGVRGTIRLNAGEGLTGLAVESRRPVSVVRASRHERFVTYPELREDRFPVLLALPILCASRTLGALVLLRAGTQAFSANDVNLALSLTAPLATSIRQVQLFADEAKKPVARKTGGGTRKVTLPGVPVVPGLALGAVAALRRPSISSQKKRDAEDKRSLRMAFEVVEKALSALVARAASMGLAKEAGFLSNYLLMAGDERLRERAFELLAQGHGIAESLGMVAREAVRTANGIVGDRFMQERARDMEDLCNALLMLASPDARAELPSKAILVGDELSVFDLLITVKSHPVGVALTEREQGPRTRVLLQLLSLPSIVDCQGLFRWVEPGEVVLLDADHGFLVINPSRADVAAVRAKRRDDKHTQRLNSLMGEPSPSMLGAEFGSDKERPDYSRMLHFGDDEEEE